MLMVAVGQGLSHFCITPLTQNEPQNESRNKASKENADDERVKTLSEQRMNNERVK